jgi:hypothetical protein
MGITISQLLAASVFNEGDVIEIEQTDGVSRRLTKTQLRALLFSDPAYARALPLVGDSISFGSASDFIVGPPSRWRTVPAVAYTSTPVPLGYAVAFPGGPTTSGIMRKATDYIQIGLPIRVEIGAGVYFYGIADDVIEFGVTIAGGTLPYGPGDTILSLAVGTPDMVKCVDMIYPAATYNDSTTLVLAKGCQHYWRGKPGFLAAYACSHMNTASAVNVNLQMNGGSNVSLTGVMPAAGTATTRGAFVSSALGTLVAANLSIEEDQVITVKTPVITGLADFLIVNMVFVVP